MFFNMICYLISANKLFSGSLCVPFFLRLISFFWIWILTVLVYRSESGQCWTHVNDPALSGLSGIVYTKNPLLLLLLSIIKNDLRKSNAKNGIFGCPCTFLSCPCTICPCTILQIFVQSDPDLVTPDLVATRFSDRINFPRYRKLTLFDPDLVATPI
eukprot:sb/3473107/